MPTSIREKIIAAITTAVGGEYDIPAPEDSRDLPVTIVRDLPEQAADDQYGISNMIIPVAIARAQAANSHDREAMRIQGNDIHAQLIAEMFADETFGNLADGIEYTGGGIEAEVGMFVAAEVQFNIRYHTVRGDPYTIDED